MSYKTDCWLIKKMQVEKLGVLKMQMLSWRFWTTIPNKGFRARLRVTRISEKIQMSKIDVVCVCAWAKFSRGLGSPPPIFFVSLLFCLLA